MQQPDNPPAFYFPLSNGRYEVKPGLFSLSTDFGNGIQDARLLQIDKNWASYYDNKTLARQESEQKYICQVSGQEPDPIINRYLVERLSTEYPGYFVYSAVNNTFTCKLSRQILSFTPDYKLASSIDEHNNPVPYINGFDALAMQIQEDLAIMQVRDDGETIVTALHLCSPNHWAAQDKIGCNFKELHDTVPGMKKITRDAYKINLHLLRKSPFIRFAWGLSTDQRLNHHPSPSKQYAAKDWQGRAFNSQEPSLFLRVERQALHGFRQQNLILFTIRTYFYDVLQLSRDRQRLLCRAVQSMDEQTLRYKGLDKNHLEICQWLQGIQ